jgi:predicted amidohydrolase
VPYGFDVVAANWTSTTPEHEWPGRGHSCVISGDGKVLAMSEAVSGNDIVLADLKVKRRPSPASDESQQSTVGSPKSAM